LLKSFGKYLYICQICIPFFVNKKLRIPILRGFLNPKKKKEDFFGEKIAFLAKLIFLFAVP